MSDTIKIGNVTFLREQVLKRGRAFTEEGKPLEVIFMKDGTKLTFPEQENSNIEPFVRGRGTELSFFGIKGLYIEGSQNNDNYRVHDCDDCTIDVLEGGTDTVDISKAKGYVRIARDDNDKLITNFPQIDMNNVIHYKE